MFIPTEELVIPTGTKTNEANTKIEMQLEIVEASISKFEHNLYNYMSSHIFH